MSTFAAVLTDISFFEVGLSLIVLGAIEQIVIRLPPEMVGPGGWLLDTGAAE